MVKTNKKKVNYEERDLEDSYSDYRHDSDGDQFNSIGTELRHLSGFQQGLKD